MLQVGTINKPNLKILLALLTPEGLKMLGRCVRRGYQKHKTTRSTLAREQTDRWRRHRASGTLCPWPLTLTAGYGLLVPQHHFSHIYEYKPTYTYKCTNKQTPRTPEEHKHHGVGRGLRYCRSTANDVIYVTLNCAHTPAEILSHIYPPLLTLTEE